jgi:alpha-L-rhamnosidase
MNPGLRTSWCGSQRSPYVRARQRIIISGCLFLIAIPAAVSQQRSTAGPDNIAEIYQNFVVPPKDARPMVRWWWFGVAVQKSEILHELQQMKADGIGGAELAFVYPEVLNDPARGLENLPFLSPAMLDDVTYAETEGRKLGLRVDLTLCSGWPYGGPSTTLTEAAGRLQTIQVLLRPGATTVSPPRLNEGDSIVAVQIVKGVPGSWDATSARPVNLTEGTASVAPGTDSRTVLFFIASHTRQQVKRSAVGAEGYVLDPFSHEAVASYLKSIGAPLVNAFGNTPPYAIFSDSLEAYGADWTPALPDEFRRRRGYDLLPHLAELVAGGSIAADTVRHDYGKTLTELVDENYLTQITDWAVDHHTRFRSQTYGTPAVSFSSQNRVTLAEGEGPQWRAFSTLRWATSANHVFGHNITSGETFTWLHSPVFRATPLDMKAEADIDLIMGENQFIFHGWPYSPPQVAEPDWSLYAAAALNDHNPWHPVMPYVTKYLARLSYLMRQGEPANQVEVLLPTDDAWASFSPADVSVTDRMKKLVPPDLIAAILSAGYNLDLTDADAIDHRGIHSQILILPATNRIPKETLNAIGNFVANGGKVIAVGQIPSMSPEGQPLKNPKVCDRRGGKQDPTACHPLFDTAAHSFVADPAQVGEALHKVVQPDFQLIDADAASRSQLGFIRRKLSFADVYFVVNTSNHEINATANFSTAYKFAEQWNPDTTLSTLASARAQPLHLAPYESSVFVFSNTQSTASPPYSLSSSHQRADLSKDWHVDFVSTGKSYNEAALTDWISDPSTIHYSGEAVYERDFTDAEFTKHGTVLLTIDGGAAVSSTPNSASQKELIGPDGLPNPFVTHTGPGMRAYYDPPIREAALVAVNGKSVGALWHPPYVLDVTKYLKPGKNQIEIRVYNTALNAWSALPPHDYKPLIAKYGDRFQMQDLDKVKPISSGLLGSVHLVSVEPQ